MEITESPEEKMWALFHKLWGRDHENPSYNKDEWEELKNSLARAILNKNHTETAVKLDHCVALLHSYVQALRGERPDMTGIGMWQIFCTNFEMATDTKIITKWQWEEFLKLYKEKNEQPNC